MQCPTSYCNSYPFSRSQRCDLSPIWLLCISKSSLFRAASNEEQSDATLVSKLALRFVSTIGSIQKWTDDWMRALASSKSSLFPDFH